MFAKAIVLSDAFLDMPMSARCLYFTLSMTADDDGFVGNPKAIMRQCGASQDDLLLLLQKRFILGFETGVIVIKHWRLNNYLQNDRHKTTTYVEEMKTLMLDSNGAYTELTEVGESVSVESQHKPLTESQKKRYEAKKESGLPYSFEYKIRQAFNGHRCPICGCLMQQGDFLRKPTIQHNKPISLGGKHEIDNISVICNKCNTSIQNRVETPPYNTDEVKAVWERIGNGLGMDTQESIGKKSINKVNKEEINREERAVKHKYGEYKNVLLTDEELEKLKTEFPDYQERIERLSSYIASTGKSYKSHLATIRNWARMDKDRQKSSPINDSNHFDDLQDWVQEVWKK